MEKKTIEVAYYHRRIKENYPIQRMRVFAQIGIGMDGKEHPEHGEGLREDGTIAFSLSALDAWDYARRAGLGGDGEWSSEWVLLNEDGTYEKTEYDEDYVHNNSVIDKTINI